MALVGTQTELELQIFESDPSLCPVQVVWRGPIISLFILVKYKHVNKTRREQYSPLRDCRLILCSVLDVDMSLQDPLVKQPVLQTRPYGLICRYISKSCYYSQDNGKVITTESHLWTLTLIQTSSYFKSQSLSFFQHMMKILHIICIQFGKFCDIHNCMSMNSYSRQGNDIRVLKASIKALPVVEPNGRDERQMREEMELGDSPNWGDL